MWNLNPILDENGGVGTLLKALFGYNGDPSLLEVLAYGAYFAVVGVSSFRLGRARTLAVGREVV